MIQITEEMIQELVDLIMTMTAIPAPSHNEGRRVAFLLDYIAQIGYPQVTTDDAKNVIIEVPSTEDKPLYLYTAHTDTVFPDTTTIPVREEEGRLYGPGIGDDTANLAGMLICLKYIKQAGLTPIRPLAYVADSCEEGLGNLKGMWAAYHRYEKNLGRHITIDGSTNYVVNRAVGSSRYELTISTKGGHSYNAFGNRNAIAVASQMIAKLYTIDVSNTKGKTTYNVGGIQGGTSVNTIAQESSFYYEYRSDEQENLEWMKKQTEELLANALQIDQFHLEDGYIAVIGKEGDCDFVKVQVKVLGHRPGMGPVDEEEQSKLSQHISHILEKHTGVKPEFSSGSTDCNIPQSKGIAAACFGIYLGAGQHTREEYIERESLKAGMEALMELMLEDYK